MTHPLRGIRVLEVASWIMVPSCGAVLSDWGAEVIKIEHPRRGDPARGLVAGPRVPGQSNVNYLLHSVNRGKRSVGLDIATDRGRALLYEIAARCDVFLTSSLPTVRQKLGIDVDEIRRANPSIVYARGSGLGPRGVERDRGGFDSATFWARAGIAHTYHHPDLDHPVAQNGAFGDLMTGAILAGGISAALVQRSSSGEPSIVDASLFGVGAWLLSREVAMAAAGDPFVVQPRMPRSELHNPLTAMYRTKDDRFIAIVGLQSDRNWPELCGILGRPELVDDPRFVDARARSAHCAELVAALDAAFATHTLAEWSERMAGCEIVWEPVQSSVEMATDPAMIANRYLVDVDQPSGTGPAKVVAPPVQFDEDSPDGRVAPELGEHTEDVLLELGLDWDEIIRLKDEAVIA